MIKFLNCLSLSSAVHSNKNENSIQILSKYYYSTLEVKLIVSYLNRDVCVCIIYDVIFTFRRVG